MTAKKLLLKGGGKWTLLFCLDCGTSRWVYRELAKNSYRHHILWLKGCPDCSNTFGGLYFTDRQMPSVTPYFINRETATLAA